MEQLAEHSKYISVDDIRNKPELIAGLFLEDRDVSVIIEKRGNKVRYAYLKTYDNESIRILEEAKNEHREIRKKGYNRQQASVDFEDARNEISKYL